MKNLQQRKFSVEPGFLLDPLGIFLPRLVHVLEFFLDQQRLISSIDRINRSSHFGYDLKNPFLLGKNHLMTKHFVLDCHSKCSHLGWGWLWPSGYSIPHGRQAVKMVLPSCARCKRYNTRPMLPPNMASLPVPRVEFDLPFKTSDFKGHLWWYRAWAFCLSSRPWSSLPNCMVFPRLFTAIMLGQR